MPDRLRRELTGPARGYVVNALDGLGIPNRHLLARSRGDLARAYHALDVYVVPSRQEGGPKGVLEAMASGVPVVTTRVGQAQDLVEDRRNGFLADVEDAGAIAEAVLRVHGDRELALALTSAGRATAEQHAYEHLDRDWEQLLNGFVARGSPHESQ